MNKILLLCSVAAVAAMALPAGTQPDPKDEVDVLFAPTGRDRLIQKRIVGQIREARRNVVLAVYQFTSKDLAEALCAAKRRGVDVRILVDGVQAAGGGPYAEEVLTMLAGAGVPVRKVYAEGVKAKQRKPEGTRPKFHHKFCVVDGQVVVTGSYNWTVLADESNHENLLVLRAPKIAARYAEQFDKVWKDGAVTEPQ